MDTKLIVGKAITDELLAAQSRPLEKGMGSPIPPMLWPGDGRAFKASNRAFSLIYQYGDLLAEEFPKLTASISERELADIIARAFGVLVAEQGFAALANLAGEELIAKLDKIVDDLLDARRVSRDFLFGCVLIRGYDFDGITIGPVTFEPREQWLHRLRASGLISQVSARRFKRHWRGQKLRPRISNSEASNEKNVLDALGRSPIACTVKTGNQSAKVAAPKALLAGRLAMTAIALMYARPSRTLIDMGLEHDGLLRRQRYAASTASGNFSASYSSHGPRDGHYVGSDWASQWKSFASLCAPIAETLTSYVDPQTLTSRPKVLNALFMSIWWFHEACRERSDLIAIAKFASSMDSLAAGHRAPGIKKLIEYRLGREPDLPWLTDGRRPQDLVKKIYEIIRNQVLHGSISDFDRDWSSERDTAELVARECLVAALSWMRQNPEVSDLRRLIAP